MSGLNSPITLDNIGLLKVVDLRQELDKRGLEKSGLKADLVKRLEKVSKTPWRDFGFKLLKWSFINERVLYLLVKFYLDKEGW